MFHVDVAKLISEELRVYQSKLPDDRIHLAEDRIFYYRDQVYSSTPTRTRRSPGLPARGHQQHHPARQARPDPLQRLDDRPDPGHGRAA
jgi:hypothetical protein